MSSDGAFNALCTCLQYFFVQGNNVSSKLSLLMGFPGVRGLLKLNVPISYIYIYI